MPKRRNRGRLKRGLSLYLAVLLLVMAVPLDTWADTVVSNNEYLKVSGLSDYPGGILTDEEGNIYVKNCGFSNEQGQVYKYKPDGTRDTDWGTGGRTDFPTTNRGVGLSFAPDGNLITTCYDGKIVKVSIMYGTLITSVSIPGFTPYCSVLNDGNIYVIGKEGSKKKIYIFDNELAKVGEGDLGTGNAITLESGYYGLAIAGDRIYTSEFGSYIYCYKKSGTSGTTWVKDTSFGSSGQLHVFSAGYAGGLFYNESDNRVYACSESQNQIVSFNPDGTNLTTVLEGAGPNNVYISDKGYAVPFFGGQSFQVFYRPSQELERDKFVVEVLNNVTAGTKEPLKLKVSNTGNVQRTYNIRAELMDANGKLVNATCPEVRLAGGTASLTVTPNENWRSGKYSMQLIISSKISGTSITISEMIQINALIPVAQYEIHIKSPVNGSLNVTGIQYVNQLEDSLSSFVVYATPREGYEVDVANSTITYLQQGLEENQKAEILVGGKTAENVYPVTITNINQNIEVSIAFRLSEAELSKKKDTALAALKSAKDSYQADSYFGDNWSKLTEIHLKAAESIQKATSETEINVLLSAALEDMAKVPDRTIDEVRKKAVEEAIKAVEEAFSHYKDSDYSSENWNKLVQVKDDAINAIKVAQDESGVHAAESTGKTAMGEIMTVAQESLQNGKDQILKEITVVEDQVIDANYTGPQIDEIRAKIDQVKAEVGNADSVDDLATVASDLRGFVDAYLTKTEKAGLQQQLQNAFEAYSADDYTTENYTVLVQIKDVGLSAIAAASKDDGAQAALKIAIEEMSAVITKVDQLSKDSEEIRAQLTAGMNERFKEADYTAENWVLLQKEYTDACNAINSKESRTEMIAKKDAALAAMAQIDTAGQSLQKAKESAVVALSNAYQSLIGQPELYTASNLEELAKAFADGSTAIDQAVSIESITSAKDDAIQKLNQIQKIKITVTSQDITFDEVKYGYTKPEDKVLTITAELEGCSEITITDVAITSADVFTLSTEATDHVVSSGGRNQDWKIAVAENLVPGNYQAEITISYNCEGKAAGTQTVQVTMNVVSAGQTMPDDLSVTHETTAGANDGTITGVTDQMEYKKNQEADSAYQQITPVNGVLTGLAPGTYDIRLAAKDHYEASEAKQYTIKMVQSDVVGGTPTPESGYQKLDGTIQVTGASGSVEYRKEGTEAYIPCNNSEEAFTITNLAEGIYHLRYAETDLLLAGVDTTIEIGIVTHTFTCDYDNTLGTVTAAGGGALPEQVIIGETIEILIKPNEGYVLQGSLAITCENATCQRKEAGKPVFVLDEITGDVALTINFTEDIGRAETIESMKQEIKEDDYPKGSEGWEELQQILQAAIVAVKHTEDAATITDIYQQYLLDIEAKKQEILEACQANYASPSNAIMAGKQESDYSSDNWEKLKELAKQAEKLLKEAETPKDLVEGMEQIYLNAAKIPTTAESSDPTGLETKKEEALAELASPSNAGGLIGEKEEYTPETWDTITKLIEAAKKEIGKDETATEAAVDLIMNNLETALAKQLTLEEEKAKAIEILNTRYESYVSGTLYDEPVWLILVDIYQKAIEDIEDKAVTTTTKINEILQKALDQMLKVPTRPEIEEESEKDYEVALTEYLVNQLPETSTTPAKLDTVREQVANAKEQCDALDADGLKQVDEALLEKLDKLIKKLTSVEVEKNDITGFGMKAELAAGLLVSKDEIENSNDIKIIVNMEEKDEDADERDLVLAALPTGRTIGTYLDITIEKVVDGDTDNPEWITELLQPAKLRMTIPKEMRGHKNYQVVRIHNDEATPLLTTQENNTLTFESNQFSTYVLTYEAVVIDDSAGGGGEDNPGDSGSGGGSGGSSSGGGSGGGGAKSSGSKSTKGTWIQNDQGWWFAKEDGTWPVNQWLYIEGKWYHFNEQGYMQSGWLSLDQKWYYLRASGDMATGWLYDQNKWYFLDTSGDMYANRWLMYGVDWYYMGADGVMLTNQWLEQDGKHHYLGTDGTMITHATVDGRYVDRDGVAVN